MVGFSLRPGTGANEYIEWNRPDKCRLTEEQYSQLKQNYQKGKGKSSESPDKRIHVNPGQAIAFLGHFVHAGAECDGKNNLRIHAYYTQEGQTLPNNEVQVWE